MKTRPEDATVETSGQSCQTPCYLELHRGRNYVVKITKAGFESKKIVLDGTSTDSWVWGNIILGGIIGPAVDYASDAAYDFGPAEIDHDLVKIPYRHGSARGIASEKSHD